MTPAQLKSSILQLAIQGKLVPQIPAEGTGEELYQQIQKEKQALIKSGKIKKEKPLPPIAEDEIPFEIPEGWRWCRLVEIASMCLGKMLDKQKNKGIPCQYLRNVNVRWGDFDLSDLLEMKFEDTNDTRYIIQKLDLIMCEGGEPGRCAVWNSNDIIHFQKALHRIRFLESINPFFYYFLFFLYANSGFLNFYFTGTTIKHLTGQALERIPIPLPPLAEQKRIVAKIEELMPLIDRYDKAWTQLEAIQKKFPGDLKKSILQQAIQGKLVPQIPAEGTGEELYQQIQKEKQALIKSGKIKKEKPLPPIAEDEIPFDIPEGWRWCRFLSIVDIATNLVQPQDYSNYMHIAPDNIEKGTGKLFNCKSVGDDKVVSANHLFKKGQVIYSKIRPLLRKAVIAPFDGLCSADMYPLNTTISGDYLLYYILSDGFANQVANAMSSRVKMPKINQDELGKVLIPLPPLAEQKRIVAKIEDLMPLCDRLIRN